VPEGRLRPFPAKPVVGPAFTPGSGRTRSCSLSHRSRNVSRVYAALPAVCDRSPVNRADKIGRAALFSPGVNAGPNTASGGKPDKSGSILRRSPCAAVTAPRVARKRRARRTLGRTLHSPSRQGTIIVIAPASIDGASGWIVRWARLARTCTERNLLHRSPVRSLLGAEG